MKTRAPQTPFKIIGLCLVAALCATHALAQTAQLTESYRAKEAEATSQVKGLLAEQRQFIASRNLHFQVGVTAVTGKNLESITGEREPTKEQVLQIQREMQNKQVNPEILKWEETLALKGCSASDRSYDARSNNLVPDIRYQRCGNCWAYSCIGPIECSHVRINGTAPKSVHLSEMQIVACSGGGTCKGGLTFQAFEWLRSTGTKIIDAANSPDQGSDSPCPATSAAATVQLADCGVIDPSGDISRIAPVDKIKEALCKYGPVACSMDATPLLQNFAGNGVFFETPSNCSHPTSNHAVMIIGWDDAKGAWLMRNSWSTSWGDNGYAWIKYDSNNIGRRAAWAIVRKAP